MVDSLGVYALALEGEGNPPQLVPLRTTRRAATPRYAHRPSEAEVIGGRARGTITEIGRSGCSGFGKRSDGGV